MRCFRQILLSQARASSSPRDRQPRRFFYKCPPLSARLHFTKQRL